MELQKIKFDKLNFEIFSETAKEAALYIRKDSQKNKKTQIRKFYDELAIWNERVQFSTDREKAYSELIVFIKMLKPKVAYTRGRPNSPIDDNFKKVFDKCIDEIKSVETLNYAKLFMEAVIGYCVYFEAEKEEKNKNHTA